MKEEYNYIGVYPDIKIVIQHRGKDSFIKQNYPDFYKYINDAVYGHTFVEKLYCFYHNIFEQSVCAVCGAPVKFESFNKGYQKSCGNSKCIKELTKQTNLQKYGAENPFASEIIKKRIIEKNIENLGVKYPMQSKAIRNKSESTFMQKYGVKHYLQCEEGKQKILSKIKESIKKREITCNERYSATNYANTTEYKVKAYTSRKQHNTFNSSSVEEEFANWLNENNITFIRQYKSGVYPYPCDFYFPDKDLYFEINGNWTHGKHQFNPNNPDDVNILNLWKSKNTKYYDIAIKVWTKTDPEKYKIAQENDLNWIAVYSIDIDEIIDAYKNK